MRALKYLLPLVWVLSFSSILHADIGYDESLNERDFHVLRDYVYTKRTINLEEKDWNLAISGDIRTEWRHLNEKRHGEVLRGSQSRRKIGCEKATDEGNVDGGNEDVKNTDKFHPDEALRLLRSRNDFDIEFNLRFDYVCNRAWGVAQLEFDNSAGIGSEDHTCCENREGWFGSGRCDDICLKKAYMGYNVFCDCGSRLDVELGRRRLYDVFDSEIQFLSRFDGLLFRYSTTWENVSDVYWNIAGFLVDERVNQFAWATEVGFLNICDTGFDVKYSFIDWTKNGKNICNQTNPSSFDFRVSQWTAYYHFNEDVFNMPVEVYGAFAWNHSSRKENCNCTRKNPNLAWYLGITFGEVVNEADWAIDLQYQWVEALAVPDEDASGIGLGNTFNDTFTFNRQGNTNFQGWRVEGLYAITDNLTLDTIIEHSWKLEKCFGGTHTYSKFELEAIYAF